MVPNEVLYLTEVSAYPNPFFSSGDLKIMAALDKITRFTRNFVVGGTPSARLMGPNGPKDKKSTMKSSLDWKFDFYDCIKAGFGSVGEHGTPKCGYSGTFMHKSRTANASG